VRTDLSGLTASSDEGIWCEIGVCEAASDGLSKVEGAREVRTLLNQFRPARRREQPWPVVNEKGRRRENETPRVATAARGRKRAGGMSVKRNAPASRVTPPRITC
jgi:hypothetical protein